MNEEVVIIVPVLLGPKNESIISVLEFLDKFVQMVREINVEGSAFRTYRLSFLANPPEMVEQLAEEIENYKTVRPVLWPVSVIVCGGQVNYGSTLAAYLIFNRPLGDSSVIITELGDGIFCNDVLETASWWARYPMSGTHVSLVFSRYGVPSNIFQFPVDEGRDHSPWYRRLGRRFVGWIFNLLITSRFGWQDTLDGATHDIRVYNGDFFDRDYVDLEPLLKALEGRNPHSSSIILLAWALAQKDSVVLSKPAEYYPTKSTLNFWGVVETFAMLFEIWYTTRILRRDWKGIVPRV